jgi:hypothetical protein
MEVSGQIQATASLTPGQISPYSLHICLINSCYLHFLFFYFYFLEIVAVHYQIHLTAVCETIL